jgi:hypothetical protein
MAYDRVTGGLDFVHRLRFKSRRRRFGNPNHWFSDRGYICLRDETGYEYSSLHQEKETDPVAETSFSDFLIPDYGQSPEPQ